MHKKITFETVLEKPENIEATGIFFPFDIEKTFGAKRVPVKVWINDAFYISTIVKMNGKYCMVVPKKVRDEAKVKAFETITVTIQRDTDKRTVELPEDFAEALSKNNLIEAFRKMSYTHQKEYVNSIIDAKKPETRLRRIEKNIEMLANKAQN
jgi:bifunctional DNA-binding transcriptional regulator/antitoxin component of YhaV-PrlF toxin-antitoxin module